MGMMGAQRRRHEKTTRADGSRLDDKILCLPLKNSGLAGGYCWVKSIQIGTALANRGLIMTNKQSVSLKVNGADSPFCSVFVSVFVWWKERGSVKLASNREEQKKCASVRARICVAVLSVGVRSPLQNAAIFKSLLLGLPSCRQTLLCPIDKNHLIWLPSERR